MMSLTMMGLSPGFLVRALFLLKIILVVLTIPLVLFMAWVLAFLLQHELIQLVKLFRWLCAYQ